MKKLKPVYLPGKVNESSFSPGSYHTQPGHPRSVGADLVRHDVGRASRSSFVFFLSVLFGVVARCEDQT